MHASAGRFVSKRCRSAAEALGGRASKARSSGWTAPFVGLPPRVCDAEADGPCTKTSRHASGAGSQLPMAYALAHHMHAGARGLFSHSSMPRQAIAYTGCDRFASQLRGGAAQFVGER